MATRIPDPSEPGPGFGATGDAGPVVTVRDPSDLGRVHEAGTSAVIWDRVLPPKALSELSAVCAMPVPDSAFRSSVDGIAMQIDRLCQTWACFSGEARIWLANDIQQLAQHFGRVLRVSHLHVRVEFVRDDACRRFHRDVVKARMICTYSGPGTQFGLAVGEKQPEDIESVPTGCPVLLKGKLWPDDRQDQLVHRSPPIEGTGACRLVVVIDDADVVAR